MNFSSILYTIILYPLVQIIEISYFLFNRLFSNTGIAIIGVSLTVTLLCLPLYIVAESWQQVERDTQAKLKPGIDRIKAAFKGDEQYMILSTFYKQNHYHPMMALRSSFGLLIQIPFFMAAYSCLSNLPALQGQSFLFIKDMGQPDAIFYIGKLPINILPITMTLINIIAGAIYCKGFPIKEKIQIYGMALLFLVILYQSPAGLVLYWTMNNVFSLIKNIFYKMKNPIKVLYFCMCGVLLFASSYILFVYSGGASLSKRLSIVIPLLLLIGIPLYLKAINWLFKVPLRTVFCDSKKRLLLFYSSGISLTILTGLVLPSTLISSSVQEFSNIGTFTSPTGFLYSPLFQSFGIFIFWGSCIYFLFHEKIQTIISLLFTILLLTGIINVYAFSGNYGSMDITLKFIGGIESQSKLFIFLNLFISLIIIAIPFILIYFNKDKIISYISLISVFAFTVLSIYNITKIKSEYTDFQLNHTQISEAVSFESKFSLSKTGKNVVIIMLDRAESSYFDHILNDNPKLKDIYSGFTYYPNTISFNGHTLMASPSLYGGYEYTPLEINKRSDETLASKHNEATLLIPRILTEQADFTATMYDTSWGNFSYISDMSFTAPYEKIKGGILNGRYTGDFKTSLPTFDDTLIQKGVNRNLFFVSIFREVPAILRPAIYYKGSWWASEDVVDLDSFIDWYGQLHFMNSITDFDNPNNSLIIFTTEVTHTNEDISSLKLVNYPLSYSDSGYEENVVSLEAIGRWFQYLKDNNCYDNTRIIIVSDHGIGYGKTFSEKYTTPDINGYAKDHLNPLLLFKDFNSSGPITTDMSFMTNADTPYLAIHEIVNDPINPFTKQIISNSAKENGVIITTDDVFMPHHSKSKNIFTIKSDSLYKVKDNIFDDQNWENY